MPTDEGDSYLLGADTELLRAQVLDTVLLTALVQCQPSRRAAVVELLSGTNSCQIESCSVSLASQGNCYTEALMWLFRSQNQHTRVLQALSEEKVPLLPPISSIPLIPYTLYTLSPLHVPSSSSHSSPSAWVPPVPARHGPVSSSTHGRPTTSAGCGSMRLILLYRSKLYWLFRRSCNMMQSWGLVC